MGAEDKIILSYQGKEIYRVVDPSQKKGIRIIKKGDKREVDLNTAVKLIGKQKDRWKTENKKDEEMIKAILKKQEVKVTVDKSKKPSKEKAADIATTEDVAPK